MAYTTCRCPSLLAAPVLGLLLFLTADVLLAQVPQAPSPTTQPRYLYAHPATGFAFPSRMEKFSCRCITFYDEDRDVSADYKWPGRADLNVYVYPAPASTTGPTFKLNDKGELLLDSQPGHVFQLNEPSASFVEHFAECKQQVLDRGKDWKHVRDSRMQADPERDGPISYLAMFENDAQQQYSELYLFVVKGHFVKIRKTCSSADSLASLTTVLRYLEWPAGAGGKPKDAKAARP